MTQNEKARSTAATVDRAEAADFGQTAASCGFHSNLTTSRCQVASALPTGAENAVDGATLAAALGLKNRRELSKAIERERRSGQPICAAVAGDHRGYYLATAPDELDKYIRSLDRRIREIRRTRDACSETLCQMSGQKILEGWNG